MQRKTIEVNMNNQSIRMGDLKSQIPIIQGGMGIGISLGNLAGAVAEAGGIGVISAAQIGYQEQDFYQNPLEANLRAIHKEYQKARSKAPSGIIGFNIMVAMQHYKEYVLEAIKAGADLIISGAGIPTELPAYTKDSSVKIAPIVSTNKAAKVILKYWEKKYNRTADMVIIEGPGAGGHLGFHQEQLETYTQDVYDQEIQAIQHTVEEYAQKFGYHIPVIVAGAISSKEEVDYYLKMKIDGVQLATPFVTTYECDASQGIKDAYIAANKEDIVIVKSPVGMPGRAIKNPLICRVLEGERIAPKRCLGCLRHCKPNEIPYCITEALIHTAQGNVEEGLIFCGKNAYLETRMRTVKEVIANYLHN